MNGVMLRVLAWSLGACFACTVSAQSASFEGLGDLPGNGEFTLALGISDSGDVVAAKSSSWDAYWGEAAIWTPDGGLRGLGMLPGHFQSTASAVSSEGGWAVGYSVASAEYTEAFAWSEGAGMVGLGFLEGGKTQSYAFGVSAGAGVIAGRSGSGRAYGGGPEAFRWTPDGGMQGLGFLGGSRPSSGASDVSADGSVIVGSSSTDGGGEAFRWTEGAGMVGLGVLDPDIQYSEAHAVSSNGRWTVGVSASEARGGGREDQAVLWTPDGEIQGLGFLPGDDYVFRYSRAAAVSDDGRLVVGRAHTGTPGASQQAFVWTPEWGMRSIAEVLLDYGIDVAAEGWSLDSATAITPDGHSIVGIGVIQGVGTQGWIVHLPIPSPGTLGLLSPGAALLLRRRR